jgi:hypothetical protein
MTYSGSWNYAKRRYDPIPAGSRANTEHHSVVSGKLAVGAGVFIQAGLGLIQQDFGTPNSNSFIRRFRLPNAVGDAVNFAGVLEYDSTNYRFPIQPVRSHGGDDMVDVVREGGMRVITFGAIPANALVYCVHTTSGLETPGMFKATAGTNSFLVKGAKWGEVVTTSGIGVATLQLLDSTNPT